MCGIVGSIGQQAPNSDLLNHQLNTLGHRGPDGRGIYIDENIALASCRLAIMAIADGSQPVFNEDKSIVLVFNGEIYNFRQIREELVNIGVNFNGNSEAEVLLNAYKKFGVSFIEKVSGMFAIVIYDKSKEELILIRDRFGEKPLWYYQHRQGSLSFASEVKALLPIIDRKEFRIDAISEIMQFGFINSPNSAYQNILQVPPASYLVYRHKSIKIEKYWALEQSRKIKISYQDAKNETIKLLNKSVIQMLNSERPSGLFLSGGYDSSLIGALMVQNSNTKVNSYSIGFTESKYDESSYAKKIATYLNTEHHESILKPDPNKFFTEILPKIDQPFADSSYLPTYELAEFARKEVVVALGGDGGDEVFGGYQRYLVASRLQKLNSLIPLLGPFIKMAGLSKDINNSKRDKLKRQLVRYPNLAERYMSLVSLTSQEDTESVISSDFQSSFATNKFVSDFLRLPSLDSISSVIRSDMDNYLPADLLVKTDIATMSHSLELRSPLLNHELVEFVASLPSDYLVSGLTTKRILKDITHSYIPRALLDRPKMGFAIPRADWLRNELKELSFDLLTDSTAKSRGWFNSKRINEILIEHQNGTDKGNIIWPALCLEIWARNWL
jgi:asparagine synthase (glutamine-hydrolysing)